MKKLLIRAEDKNRWERRTPLIPADLQRILVESGSESFVEESEKRIFSTAEYRQIGARICQSMEPGEVILGVKEIPVEKILKNKIYLFFSHTIKGQRENMPLLKKIMDSGSTLIDYERITTDENRRIVYFGRYAGDAGTIDILSLMGEYWAAHQIDTPLIEAKRAHEYSSVEDAKEHLKRIGKTILRDGFPEILAPITVGVLGYGNVSQGAQQILDCLPNERVEPGEIVSLFASHRRSRNQIYITVFKEEDLVENISGETFHLEDYYENPERYRSCFSRYLPYFTILINAVYWDQKYPRFVTWEGLKELAREKSGYKLKGIADITCDTNGSIECNIRSTDSDMPAYQVDPITRKVQDGHTGQGIVVLAIDNLPCELPRDSSTFFSHQLAPLIPDVLRADYSQPLESSGLPSMLQKAVIVYNGKLTENYRYLDDHLPN